MSYTKFDPQKNALLILRESLNSWDKPSEISLDGHDYLSVIRLNNLTIGVKLDKFLSTVELKGYRAETLFKELLDQISIPYLHIGQTPGDHSMSLKASNSKRPDFLINLPNIGKVMIDVKCRKKMGFTQNNESLFQINKDEIEQLFSLNQKLLIPVWIAFLDQSEIFHIHDKQKQKTTFYLISISELKQYCDKLKKALSEREFMLLSAIRIPSSLLSPFAGEFHLKFGLQNISDKIIDKFSKEYKLLIAKIEDLILKHISKKPSFKSKLSLELRSSVILRNEIDHVLGILIQEGRIVSKSGQTLKINI